MNSQKEFKLKYLKYKSKYLRLKEQEGGLGKCDLLHPMNKQARILCELQDIVEKYVITYEDKTISSFQKFFSFILRLDDKRLNTKLNIAFFNFLVEKNNTELNTAFFNFLVEKNNTELNTAFLEWLKMNKENFFKTILAKNYSNELMNSFFNPILEEKTPELTNIFLHNVIFLLNEYFKILKYKNNSINFTEGDYVKNFTNDKIKSLKSLFVCVETYINIQDFIEKQEEKKRCILPNEWDGSNNKCIDVTEMDKINEKSKQACENLSRKYNNNRQWDDINKSCILNDNLGKINECNKTNTTFWDYENHKCLTFDDHQIRCERIKKEWNNTTKKCDSKDKLNTGNKERTIKNIETLNDSNKTKMCTAIIENKIKICNNESVKNFLRLYKETLKNIEDNTELDDSIKNLLASANIIFKFNNILCIIYTFYEVYGSIIAQWEIYNNTRE